MKAKQVGADTDYKLQLLHRILQTALDDAEGLKYTDGEIYRS